MLRHQQIRAEQSACKAKYEAHEITVDAYVTETSRLNANLKEEEKKMYAVSYGDQLDLLRFIDATIPAAFRKIHARFPHLTFDEVMTFERMICANGGIVMTHSGVFVHTKRPEQIMNGDTSCHARIFMSWTCCKSACIMTSTSCNSPATQSYIIIQGEPTNDIYAQCVATQPYSYGPYCHSSKPYQDSPCLRNRNPTSQCDNPSIFSLINEKDDTPRATVAEIKAGAQERIDDAEREIATLRRKIAVWDDMLRTMDSLVDQIS